MKKNVLKVLFRKKGFWYTSSFFFLFVIIAISFVCFIKNKQKNIKDSKYNITSIVQTGPEKEALKTLYLAELLGLSEDKPTNLVAFDIKKAEKKLLLCPLIKKVSVKKIYPSAVYIDYQVRHPIAWLCDYDNVAVDIDGYIFPVTPFLSPKRMPSVFLNLPEFGDGADSDERYGGSWNDPIKNRHMDVAIDILKCLDNIDIDNSFCLKSIDVSHAFFPSYGKREIVLLVEDEIHIENNNLKAICCFPKYLRLSSNNYRQQLGNYFILREKMLKDYHKQLAQEDSINDVVRFETKIIDLRIDKLAYVRE
jgi:hypothetical protein